MDKFNTLLEAAQLAATRCGSWSFAIDLQKNHF